MPHDICDPRIGVLNHRMNNIVQASRKKVACEGEDI